MSKNTFRGGVHPPEAKELSQHLPLETMPIPERLVLPLSQHMGKQAKALVSKGDEVNTGALVAEADGFISAPVHSPVTGRITGIIREQSSSGALQEALAIQTATEQKHEFLTPLNPQTAPPEQLLERIQQSGIVGQGGAAFPTFVKLSPPKDKRIDTILINGCECEPYLTRDYRLMLDRTDELVSGLKIIMKVLRLQKGYIAIEDNKPAAIQKLREATAGDRTSEIIAVKTKYPQGGEKILIKAVLNREVPPSKLPMDVGAVVQNVGTAISVHDAIVKGQPVITATLTVTGKGIKNPRNLVVWVGTYLKDVIDFCGGFQNNAARVIIGGPMMGIAQHSVNIPITKATSGILVLARDEIIKAKETACLKCGKCVSVCALNLIPTRLARLSQLGRFEEAEQMLIANCMECGTCAYECPARIPLVQWMRLGKQAIIRLQAARN
jgi:electron transport complex protein RnfC